MFRRRKILHVGTDFGNNSDGSKVATDTGSGLENSKFLLIGSGERKNEFLKLCFLGFKAFIMSFDYFKFADLFRYGINVNSVTELVDVNGRHTATDNKIMLKQVSNTLGVFLVIFSTDSFNIFEMSKDNRTVIF